MAEVICQRCGHPNSSASNFCSSCGLDLARAIAEETTGQHAAISATDTGEHTGETLPLDVDAGDAVFVVKRGPKAGSRFMLDDVVTSLGRHPESDIFLDDITVSRRHAEVRFEDGVYRVADVSSLNGTYLNRERIETDGARLTSGDEVQVGKFRLVFLTGESA